MQGAPSCLRLWGVPPRRVFAAMTLAMMAFAIMAFAIIILQPISSLAAPGPATGDELAAAIVSVVVDIPPSARTAGFLGTHREGSGVLIGEDGLILTIGYLILEAERIRVTSSNGKPMPATVVGYDSQTGFGLLRTASPLNLKPLQLGDSNRLKQKDPVLVVSRGGSGSIHSAVVTSRHTFAGYWEYLLEEAIFTAPPVREFSGAALVDGDFRLVGIGSLYVTDSTGKGIEFPGNMFVPINSLKPILAQLVKTGSAGRKPRPWLGLILAEQHGRVMVSRVSRDSPASKAGIQPGDIILEIEGGKVNSMEKLYRQLWGLGSAGVVVELRLLQGADLKRISVTSRDRGLHYGNAPGAQRYH